MNNLIKVTQYILTLPKLVPLFARLYFDRRVPYTLKISALAAFVYIISPLDLIPDVFLGFGLIDDIIFALLVIQLFIEQVPNDILEGHLEALNIEPGSFVYTAKEGLLALSTSFSTIFGFISKNRNSLIKKYSSSKRKGDKDNE